MKNWRGLAATLLQRAQLLGFFSPLSCLRHFIKTPIKVRHGLKKENTDGIEGIKIKHESPAYLLLAKTPLHNELQDFTQKPAEIQYNTREMPNVYAYWIKKKNQMQILDSIHSSIFLH